MNQSSGVTRPKQRNSDALAKALVCADTIGAGPPVIDLSTQRRRRLTHRALPAVGGLAALALAAGALVGSLGASADEDAAGDFAEAWERGDERAMYSLLSDSARAAHPFQRFRRAYRRAADTATLRGVSAGDPDGSRGDSIVVPMTLHTRVFGRLHGELLVPVEEERVDWDPSLVFPELREGERLRRKSVPPERATLLSRNGRVLAEGPAGSRSSPLPGVAASIAGSMEPEETPREREALYKRGFPRKWPVGQSGLEKAFDDRLAGRPGGELLAGRRVLARARPRKAAAVRTTIDPRVQESAAVALAGRFGGIAALDPLTGEILALAGIAFSAPQPPGSTFKIVTTTAALEAGLVKLSDEFPVQTAATIDGVELENAGGESCGGSFRDSFAHSCNSVFAPLGVKVGAARLVDAAERYGWNAKPTIPGEVASTLPPASEIRTPLEVGSTAIGQGKVLATPLRLASAAQVIAAGGVRYEPTLAADERVEGVRVTTRRVARTIRSLMVDVVSYGTGTAAAIPNVKVAGKTGTAELEDTRGPNADQTAADGSNTDAWFAAFAPAIRPRIAVGVMFVRAGAGGATAAPAARVVLEEGLKRRR
jgi:peptidoglycan glycosyltransferase